MQRLGLKLAVSLAMIAMSLLTLGGVATAGINDLSLGDSAINGENGGRCKIEVRAVPVDIPAEFPVLAGRQTPGWHLFIVYTDQNGYQYEYQGGPTLNNPVPPPWGQLVRRHTPGLISDQTAPRVTIAKGSSACSGETSVGHSCFQQQSNLINSRFILYNPIPEALPGEGILHGNSNSYVYTLLKNCDLWPDKPWVLTPGWGINLTEPDINIPISIAPIGFTL